MSMDKRMDESLDRHITGNYGADQFRKEWGFTLTDRKEIIKDCLKKPFKLVFTPLGDYEDLEYDFKTEKQAKEELAKLIRDKEEEIKSAGGFHAEILKRIIIESKEVEEE